MANFSIPVELYMSSPAHTITSAEDLRAAQALLVGLGISSLAVVDATTQQLVGVISMTDLIRVGRRQAGARAKSALLTLPDKEIGRCMTESVISVPPDEPIASAASKMVKDRIHRVYVEGDAGLMGVLSTRDIMLAIRDKRVSVPVADWMSSPAFTVRAEEPISLATERLEKAGVSGLVVVDQDCPVGLFTQREALQSRDDSRDTPLEAVMNSAMLALETTTPLHRAAAQAAALRVRRVIAVKNRRIEGILTGLDFARAAA